MCVRPVHACVRHPTQRRVKLRPQVVWVAGEPDDVVRSRLRNASVIHGLHEERVFLGLSLARADVPGSAVSAAGYGAGEAQVHARLDVRLLPPQVGLRLPISLDFPLHVLADMCLLKR